MKDYSDYIENLSGNILLGCDGFVDETYEIVEERQGPSDFSAVENLKDFGQLIVDRAGGGVRGGNCPQAPVRRGVRD
jgi:hypothetical protein